MLHDVSAMVEGLGESGGSCVLVVVDNRGGGIFSFLPQATSLDADAFRAALRYATPHNLVAIAEAFGHERERRLAHAAVRRRSSTGLGREGLTVVVAQVPSREQNVRLHEELNRGGARVLDGRS
jgi:2-succinyl-5-enolpyruvyl-6-hydroxy-3-cyclohexene-1-carboxylate synthase